MKDFFVSYTAIDKHWAEWISYVLEEENYKVIVQAWDFLPGKNFVLEMHNAASLAAHTIMVLSPDYLDSRFTAPEWATAFGADSTGSDRKLIPVMVRACRPGGLLDTIVQIRIHDMDEEQARRELLAGVDGSRKKPTARPTFPGLKEAPAKVEFPGTPASVACATEARNFPKVKKNLTDLDIDRFMKSSFGDVRQYFEKALKNLEDQNSSFQTDLHDQTSSEFFVSIYRDGKLMASCRIWLGKMFSQHQSIYYSTAGVRENSYNENITITDRGKLALKATMSGFSGSSIAGVDTADMNSQQAAQYLWNGFVRWML